MKERLDVLLVQQGYATSREKAKAIIMAGQVYVDGQKADKPGNTRLIQSIVDSQNIIGNGYVARGYCAGYRTEFKSDENPITNLLDGHLTVHTYLAPYIPAEYIENIREYDTEALEAALTGGGE